MGHKIYNVTLGETLVGSLAQTGDYTVFTFKEEYFDNPNRPILGLHFEDRLHEQFSASLRLHPWFSNLLPEGRLRDWIALSRGVSADREMELLAQVGHDLPGAVVVSAAASDTPRPRLPDTTTVEIDSIHSLPEWSFSLAGVGLKFSMLKTSDRLTLAGHGASGNWIVKTPDPDYSEVPLNEYAMMELARRVGIETPQTRLVHRDELAVLPDIAWRSGEEWAFAVKRFDRTDDGSRIHIEDFLQVLNRYPLEKYSGNFETIAAISYREQHETSLLEFVKRITLNTLIANGDAHFKNWSLFYRDPKNPTLSPVYDILSTAPYREGHGPEDLGLKLRGQRRFEKVRIRDFDQIGRRISWSGCSLSDVSRDAIHKILHEWPSVRDEFLAPSPLAGKIDKIISSHSKSLLS